jgi:hypothetical protein
MNIIRKSMGLAAIAVVIVMMEGTGLSQCAMCRTALENSVEGQAIAEGFRYGILFLLSAPYAIAGGVGYGLFRAFRKKKADTAEE